MKTLNIFLLVIVFNSIKVNAQSSFPIKDSTNTSILEFSGLASAPVGQFSQAGYWSGGGFEADLYSKNLLPTPVKGFNLRIGGSFTYSGQGSVRANVFLHDPANAPGTQLLRNNLFGMDVKAKIIYDQKTVRPYADVFWGFRNFSSAQMLTINNPLPGYQSMTKTNIFSTAVSTYGASLGCLIKLNNNVFIDLKSSYITSNNPVPFVNLSHLVSDGKMYMPQGNNSIPSLLSFQVGVVFKVNFKNANFSYGGSGCSGYSGYSYSPVYRSSGCNYHSYGSRSSSSGSRSGGGLKPLR